METICLNRGGWFAEMVQTGASSGMKYLLTTVSTVSLLVTVGTGACADDLYQLQQHRINGSLISNPVINYVAAARIVRTPVEDLKRIREVLSPAVSDLAKCFKVSRQTLYNWLNGEQLSPDHLVRLNDLAVAADMVAESGQSFSGYTLKRKILHGKNLFEIVQDGGSAKEAALLLLNIVKQESSQREFLSARLAGRSASQDFGDSDLMQENDKV